VYKWFWEVMHKQQDGGDLSEKVTTHISELSIPQRFEAVLNKALKPLRD